MSIIFAVTERLGLFLVTPSSQISFYELDSDSKSFHNFNVIKETPTSISCNIASLICQLIIYLNFYPAVIKL